MYGNYDEVCEYNSYYIEHFGYDCNQQNEEEKNACIDGYMHPNDENFCKNKFSKEALGIPADFPYDDSFLINICKKGQADFNSVQ